MQERYSIVKNFVDIQYFLSRELQLLHALQRQNPQKTWCMGPYVEVDYNLTLQYFHSRVDSNTLTMGLGNPICQSWNF